ncbi:MAG TPA: Ig-like domain-containing protein [Gemmatimonadales bacterium]|nr:Ig-like domain-containing protein [Gemmatimonadales bacterium]
MTRRVAMRMVAYVSVALATLQCVEATGPRALDNSIGVILSGLVPSGSGAPSGLSSATVTTRVVYVSLSPDAVPGGTTAAITNRATGAVVTAAVVNGGFDPVPIGASIGDTLAVAVSTSEHGAAVSGFVLVAARRAPRVVRTNPPPGGRDVPLNSTVVVIFSEPLDPGTLDTTALQLSRDSVLVAGTARLAAGSSLIAEFQPASLLAPLTTYRFSVSPNIQGVAGDAVTAAEPVSFTTGTGVQSVGAAKLAFTVQPTNATAGAVLSSVVVAIQDSLGNTMTSANDVVIMRSACVPGSSCDGTYTGNSLSGGVSVQAVNGLATFSTLRLALALNGYTLVATSGTLPPVTSAPFDVAAGGPALLMFVGFSYATVGQPFSADVAIEDGAFNTVSNATNAVTLSLASGPAGARLTGTLTASAVNGVAHFTDVSLDQPGTYTIKATATGLRETTIGSIAYDAGALIAVSTGDDHSCGLTLAGVAYCWGRNDHGQLGDSTTTNRTAPAPVAGGLTFRALVAGGRHTCGLSTSGPWFCWGANESGQLGDGTTSDQWSPVAMAGSLQFIALSLGESHTCGIVSQPDLEALYYCWGLNDHGQLGDGTTTPRTSPTLVAGIVLASGPVSAGGDHTCAQNFDLGETFCWGANNHGQLADATTIDRPTAVIIVGIPCDSGPPGFVPPVYCPRGAFTPFNMGMTTGRLHTCAGAGGAFAMSFAWYCWGANGNGQLGDGTTTDRLGPVLVNAGQQFGLVSAGGSHTCAIGAVRLPTPPGQVLRGTVFCWGSNSNGQLGDGTTTQRTSPVSVSGGLTFMSVSAGANHTCAVSVSGVYCWGSNAAGQLGNGSTTDSSVPVKVVVQ